MTKTIKRRALLAGAGTSAAALLLNNKATEAAYRSGDLNSLHIDSNLELSVKRFPRKVAVVNQQGEQRRFYEDLVKDKRVMINFMSVESELGEEGATNLSRVHSRLADRFGNELGRSVFLYTIIVDTEVENTELVKETASKFGAGPGWMFLGGEPNSVQAIRDALFFTPGKSDHGEHRADSKDCSLGLVRYGNENTGIWGSAPVCADPDWLVARLAWVSELAAQKEKVAPVRRGPPAANYGRKA